MEYKGCKHKDLMTGRGMFRAMRSRELSKKNCWVYSCQVCRAVLVKQLISVDTPLGPKWETRTYLSKNTLEELPDEKIYHDPSKPAV